MKMKSCFYKKTSYRNKGATMIAAIVILGILIVFTFSLTLIAYTLYSSQNKNTSSLKCAEAANSLSVALNDELTYEDLDNELYPEKESYLYRYLRYNLCQDSTWPFYVDENTENHRKVDACRYFELKYNSSKIKYDKDGNPVVDQTTGENVKIDGVEGLPGKTTVCIYWMLPEGVEYQVGKTMKDNYNSQAARQNIRLFVEVTCEAASQTYTVKREYLLQIDNYDLDDTTSLDRKRYNYLKNDSIVGDPAVNPCEFEMDADDPNNDELYCGEKWIWIPTDE